jgi:hypothetical protein
MQFNVWGWCCSTTPASAWRILTPFGNIVMARELTLEDL